MTGIIFTFKIVVPFFDLTQPDFSLERYFFPVQYPISTCTPFKQVSKYIIQGAYTNFIQYAAIFMVL